MAKKKPISYVEYHRRRDKMAEEQTMAQKTAINWLREKLEEAYDKEGKLPLAYTFSLLNKAETIEKEQIEDAWMDGNAYQASPKQKSLEYYNQNYKK